MFHHWRFYNLLVWLLGTDTLKNIYLCGKHFDSEDILDTQKYLDIDGVYKTRKIKAILKKGAIPKYLPNCPSYLSDKSTKPQRLDKGRIECDLQMQVGLFLLFNKLVIYYFCYVYYFIL